MAATIEHQARWRVLAGGLALLFGVMTLLEGGHVLFGGEQAQIEAGRFVPFVLVFNFSAGFVYVMAGGLTLAARPAAAWLARVLTIATLLVFVALGVHIAFGGAFELRTLVAMTLRSMFWLAQALVLPRLLPAP